MLAQSEFDDYFSSFTTPAAAMPTLKYAPSSPTSPTDDDGICPSTAPPSRLGSPTPDSTSPTGCNHRGKHANGHKCGKSRNDFNNDEEFNRYLRRRANNNDSATRSRHRKRAIQQEEAGRLQIVEEENKRLKATVAIYYDMVMKLTGRRRVSSGIADVHAMAQQLLEQDEVAANTLKNVDEPLTFDDLPVIPPLVTPIALMDDLFSWDKQGLLDDLC